MTSQPHLHPTAAQSVRAFLTDAGVGPAPWASAHEVLEQLVSLLHARQGDDVLWRNLESLLRSFDTASFDHYASPDAEVMASEHVRKLVLSLRSSLDPKPDLTQRFKVAGMQSSAAAACLMLLSSALTTATGCSRTEKAGSEGVTMAPDPTTSTLPSSASVQDASVDARDGLEEMFRDGAPEEIATKLEKMIEAGTEARARDASTDAQPPKRPPPTAVPVYKGVTLR